MPWEDIVGNKMVIQKIKAVLGKPERKHNILVFAPSGAGKSLLCDTVVEAYGGVYDILEVKRTTCDTEKEMKKLIENFIHNKTIQSFFAPKNKLIVFDDIDIYIRTERGFASFVQFIIEESKNAHVFFTCCKAEERKLAFLKKAASSTTLYLATPSVQDSFLYVSSKLGHVPAERVLAKAKLHNGNIRAILNDISCDYEKNDKQAEAEIMKQKALGDSNIYDITHRILSGSYNIRDLQYVSDSLVPLLLYENYPHELFENRFKTTPAKQTIALTKIMSSFVAGEMLEHHIYKTTDWDVAEYVTMLKAGGVIVNVNNMNRKKNTKLSTYNFSPLLTRMAAKCVFLTNLGVLKACFQIHDTHVLYALLDRIGEYITDKQEIPEVMRGVSDENKSTIFQYLGFMHNTDKKLITKLKRKKSNLK
jgi:hypothetical protein